MTVYAHECPEWDWLCIDLFDEEIFCCGCFGDDEIVKSIKKHIGNLHDCYRKMLEKENDK